MLGEILAHLKNWFVVPNGIHNGAYAITEGSITLPFLVDNQYFRIVGSVFNDGVYKYPAVDLTDETFEGSIWALAIPAELISLETEISAWQEKNAESAFSAESFGGYSYTRASAAGGQPITWREAFRSRLNGWRRM